MGSPVKGHASTHGDSYQLNTTNVFRQAVVTHPEQQIHHRDAEGRWHTTNFASTWARIGRAANLLTQLGVGPGDVVGVMDWNSLRHFECYWAVPGLGAVLLQMNVRLGAEDLAYVIEHSGASVILVDRSLLDLAEKLAKKCPQIRQWVVMMDRAEELDTTLSSPVDFESMLAGCDELFDWPVIEETSAYSACYTTGTTGRPKGVFYSHRGIVLHSMMWAADHGLRDADCVMLTTPMFHAQCWGLPQVAVYARSQIVLPGRYSAEDTGVLADAIVQFGVTMTNGAPAIFEPLLAHLRDLDQAPDLSGTRMMCGGSEPPISLMRGFADYTGAQVIHGYGATETTPMVVSNRIKPSLAVRLSPDEVWQLRRSQGLAVGGVDIKLLGPAGEWLPHDGQSVGEVCFRGPWVIESYWNSADSEERFHKGYWRSGDLGVISSDGYLKITDRLKDVIKSGGEWISSVDIENALAERLDIREAAVVGAPHPKWQERPVALMVANPGLPVDLDDVRAHLAGRFARWQIPDEFMLVKSLPRTSVGKIDKKALRTQVAHVYRGIDETSQKD